MQLLLTLFVSLILGFSGVNSSRQIVGKWHLQNGLDLEIYEQDGTFSGKIIALNDFNEGQKLDEKNPEKELRNRSLIGLVILTELEYNAKTMSGRMA